jgi:hypothetical protein
MRASALVLAALLALAPGARAADEPEPIEADRSGAATGTATVPPGALQLEGGFAYGRERVAAGPTETRFALETGLRVGVTERLEVGVLAEPLVRLRGEVEDTGPGRVTLVSKYRFLEPPERSPWPSLGLLPFVTLPVTEEPFGSGKTDVGAIVLASFDLPAAIGLDVNAGLAAIGQNRPAGYLLQAIVAAGVSRAVAGSIALFADLFYSSREEWGGRDTVLLDGGIVWRLARNVALDASVVTSVVGAAPDWTVRAGASIRLPR